VLEKSLRNMASMMKHFCIDNLWNIKGKTKTGVRWVKRGRKSDFGAYLVHSNEVISVVHTVAPAKAGVQNVPKRLDSGVRP
jgi:hypothetical protein